MAPVTRGAAKAAIGEREGASSADITLQDASGDESETEATNLDICDICQKANAAIGSKCTGCGVFVHDNCAGFASEDKEKKICKKCRKASTSAAAAAMPLTLAELQTPKNAGEFTKIRLQKQLSSRASTSSSHRQMKLQLRQLDEQKQAEMRYISKKYEIMQKYESSAGSQCESQLTQRSRTSAWVNSVIVQNAEHNADADRQEFGRSEEDALGNAKKVPREKAIGNASWANATQGEIRTLNTQQMCARQALAKDLPTFSGRPEEWPLFLSSFESSTKLCGFSNEENLLRLQRALKGKAFECMSSRLTLPALVPQIMATLRMMFGRPEHIINSLLTKLRSSPSVNINKLDTLISFALEVQNITATMEAAKLELHLNNPLLTQELLAKLPAQMRLDWVRFVRSNQDDRLIAFSKWLVEHAEDASSVTTISVIGTLADTEKRSAHRVSFHEEGRSKKAASSGIRHKVNKAGCPVCNEAHAISVCNKFKEMDISVKWNMVHENKLCRTCLNQHDLKFCNEIKDCGVNECTRKHHPLLHKVKPEVNTGNADELVATHYQETSNTLYRLVPITIYGNKTSCDVFAFMDDGSGPTLVEKSVLRKLGIQGVKKDLCLRWTDGTTRVEENSDLVELEVSASGNSSKKLMLHDVRSVERLDLPTQTMNVTELSRKYNHLRGLPVQSYLNAVPQIIIGLNNRSAAMPIKFREGKPHEPAATKTRLGWTIYGIVGHRTEQDNQNFQMHICECDDDVALQKLVVEALNSEKKRDESEHRKQFNREQLTKLQHHTVREGDHFVVKLLWKSHAIELPDNYIMAFHRLKCFETKLTKDEFLKNHVNMHIANMEAKGYIRKLSPKEIDADCPRKWYLPTFAVRNANKPQKIRLVWDAAAQFKGVSLNSCLDKGPDLLTTLTEVLYNFRVGKIGISGDISEMFHRVWVAEEDQHSQRFLWRGCDETKTPEVYLLQVMSFGATCSPALAQFVKNQNALEYENKFPRAVKCILERHYVDDMLDSVNTIQEAIELAKDVRDIHKKANFHIRNWLSNSQGVVEALGDKGTDGIFCNAGKRVEQTLEAEKVLGMWWRTVNDSFTFDLKFTKATEEVLRGEKMPTKRELLRLIMSIFDPLGLLTHYMIDVRILFQKVWRSGIEWDQTIPAELEGDWKNWLVALPKIHEVEVPRCYFGATKPETATVELHVFVDASENAYASVAYFRIEDGDCIEVSFVCAKAKVAPLQPMCIPRLELLGAVMGARLGNAIKKFHATV